LSSIADWQAALLRVMSFREATLAIERSEPARHRISVLEGAKTLSLENMSVHVSNREVGLDVKSLKVRPGEHILIIGKSGIGKSLFFRAIAGLWPWGRGKVKLPPRTSIMFLPQRSYVAIGSLRHVLAYPVDPGRFRQDDLACALRRTNLGHLVSSLDRTARWDKLLTANERFYLSFAQLLVHRPQWVISDEALGHLSEDDLKLAFSLFEKELSTTTLISITSNDTPHAFYSRVCHLISRPIAKPRRHGE
jgi:putative ATP-binding cassette transporter